MPENVRSRNQPILRFNVILQHDWPIEQCRLHIRVFFGGKTKSPCLDLFIHWLIKQITNIGSSPGALTSLVSSRLLVKGSSRVMGRAKEGRISLPLALFLPITLRAFFVHASRFASATCDPNRSDWVTRRCDS